MAKRKQPTPAYGEQAALEATKDLLKQIEVQAEVAIQANKFELGPAKHFVRRDWVRVIQRYMRHRARDGVHRPLKYLTLPGQNASDIGLFWREGLLTRTDDGRLNVAICDRLYADEVALNLTPLGGVLVSTTREFEEELDRPKISNLRPHFPFDVINLDICGCLIPAQKEKQLRMLRWLFRLQRRQGFLLLLTTRPESKPNSTSRLPGMLRSNLKNESKFRAAFVDEYGGDDVRHALADVTRFNQIIIPKTVAKESSRHGYRTREHFAGRYTRQKDERPNESYEMVCHSFEFEPIGRLKAALKYEVDTKAVPSSDIGELFELDLSTRIENQARTAYRDFIASLPPRATQNITEILKEDRERRTQLERDAKSLEGWWQH